MKTSIVEDSWWWRRIWVSNKGVCLILLSEICGASLDAVARLLQQGSNGVHPFQVIVARMSVTFVLANSYMWYNGVPNFPLGKPSVRGWLILRSLFGFGGIFCLYYSVGYLPLAIATVTRFLVPIVTALACAIFLGTSFTRTEFLAGVVALLGVVVIAHPARIFGQDETEIYGTSGADPVTPAQRLAAIIVSLLGVIGASGAYTTIRVIGNRAHALLSVSYFAILTTVGSTLALLVIPGIGFTMPAGPHEWALHLSLGIMGFALQFLLTAGLQIDKSSRATAVMYTQILFALAFDWGVWGVLPGRWSVFGGFIVIASTLWATMQKQQRKVPVPIEGAAVDEESALLGDHTQEERRRSEL